MHIINDGGIPGRKEGGTTRLRANLRLTFNSVARALACVAAMLLFALEVLEV